MQTTTELLVENAVRTWVRKEVHKLVVVEFDKALTAEQHWRDYQRRLASTQSRILQPAVASWMKWLRGELQRGIPTAMRARKPSKAVAVIVDWKAIEEESERRMRQPVHEALVDAASAAMARGLRKQEQRPQFDPMGEGAVNWTWDRTAELVTNVTRTTKDAIMLFMQHMVTYGLPATKVARALRPVVGLTEPHARAVSRALTSMLDEGVPWEDAIKSAERYAQKLHVYRTKMIARTESSFAQAEGVLQGYEDMGITKVRWIADPEACDICRPRHNKVYGIKEAHGMQPAHPHCECTWVAAT